SVSRRLDPKEPLGSQRAASPTPKQAPGAVPGHEGARETGAQGPAGQEAGGPRRTLQVDSRTQRSGRSPSVSPDRGSTPTSPYSVPQIAPLPSSTLCPICKTSDLTSTPSQPNFNTCTQCHSKVCNQCGFNPNPHLTQVQEWLCLNCQMQRALGMDMTTAPRSKSQQQLHSPALSPAHAPAKPPLGKPEQERPRGPGGPQPGPRPAETAKATTVPGPAQAAAPPERGKVSPQPPHPVKPSTAEPRPPAGEAPGRSATAVPPGPGAAEQAQEGLTGKLFGLGASLLTQASTLMSVQPEADAQGQPAPSKGPPKIVFSDASKEAGPRPPGSGPGPGPAAGAKAEPAARAGAASGPGAPARTGGTPSPKHGRAEQQAVPKAAAKPKAMPKDRPTCPLCQAELNVGSKGPANYNTCTACKLQVCNLCGFNPTHLVEKSEWLCLNCQTKRLLEGSLGEPAPCPPPASPQPPAGAPHRAAGTAPPKQKGPQGPGQPSGPLPAKASPLPTKASPQAKPLRASEPSRTPSGAQEKKTGPPAKAEPVPKPPPETALPPGTPKAKAGARRTEPATPAVKAAPEAPKGGEAEVRRPLRKMREVEQQRIRSTVRKTRRDKEELRAQRRRERSKTPPSNLSPIEDASPTEELRQAAEMEELHRSSCSEYSPSPSLDSEAEALDGGPARLYKSGSEYSLPTFMSLYSPTEPPAGSSGIPSAGRPLKSAEEAYEEMMRKAELLQQRQQGQVAGGRGPQGGPSQPTGPRAQGSFEFQEAPDRDYSRAAPLPAEGTPAGLGAAMYEETLQTSQSLARGRQASSRDLAFAEDKKKEKQFLNAESAYVDPMKQNGGPLTPGTSPTQLAAPVPFSTSTSTSSDGSGGRVIPDVRVTQHFAKEPQDPRKLHSSPASPSPAPQEASTSFPQGPGAPATTARGYGTLASPAGSERSPSPSATAHGYGQSPTTANYGSQTEEMPQAPSGPAAAREKPLRVSDGKGGPAPPSQGYAYFPGSSPPLSPSSPSESPTFSPGKPGPRATAEFSTQTPSLAPASDMPRSPGAPTPSPMVAQGTQTPHGPGAPRLAWQQSPREAPFMVITLASAASSQTRMVHASASTSPVSPTDTQPTPHGYSQTTPLSASPLPSEPPGPPGFPRAASAGADGPLALYGWGALPAENISLCRISSVPGTSRVEPGPRPPGSAVVDLRTAVKPTPIILTDQGMDLTSLAVEARKYGLALEPGPGRQSTAVQPLVINLNAQEQTQAFIGTATTVSITVASSVLLAQQKQPVVYGDPFQSRLDFGQGTGSPVCLAQVRQVEQAVQTAPYRGGPRGRPREAKVARYNLPNQVAPLARRDVLITQMGTAQSTGLKAGPVPELGARKPHTVLVQMAEGAAGTVTTLLPEEPAGAVDLTGMRPESQLACCDVSTPPSAAAQREERQAQFALQREQLAQQRLQLEQIQQLQQQLQQQLEEQKQRQKAPFPVVCDGPGRGPPPAATELAQNGQYWPPLTHAAFIALAGPEGPGQPREPVLHRGLPSSASDMSLQTEEPWEAGRSGLRKRHSMPRLRDTYEAEPGPEPSPVRRIADSSVQTDDEDGEGRYFLSRRRRTRRSADCSVQTDEEDNAEWEQPVRRRRPRLSRHSDSGSDSKHDAVASSSTAAPARATSSVGIQTISDCSVQTEPDQLPRVSPAIHITAATDPKVEIVRYISAPEKTGRGESLACQTEPDGQAQGGAGPQLVGPAAISPYLPGIQIVTPGPLGRFEKKKPDPLELGYQAHLPPESLSQLVSGQPPKSPQVLYSPVSPLSPHRLLDAPFASSERLSKAHVSPQKHFAADGALRQQTLPRPVKTLQRSLSDPKPLSPTAEESAKERFSLYQLQGGLGSQVSALPPNGLVRKVKRTLPSPPPEEAHLPLAGQPPPQLYAASLLQRGLPAAVPAKASLLRELDRDLRLVEHESTKLRKKQAELDEEEKEIDAKLKYLELGITQRKESLAKDRGGRDYAPLRGLGEHRDYLSDSELNQLRLQGCATPGQYADFPIAAAAPATPSGPAAFQQPRLPAPAPQYSAGSAGPTPNGFPAHQAPAYPGPSTYPAPAFPPGTSYPAEPGLQSQQAFRPTGHYAAQTPMPTTQSALYPVPADSRAPHPKPRQTSLADLEQKVPTNYEVIASPAVAMSSAPSETSYSGPVISSSYEQSKTPELPRASDRSSTGPAPTYPSDSHYASLEQNVPRNYVMIDDISELTKVSTSTALDSQRLELLGPSGGGRPGKEPGEPGALEGPTLPCCYARGEEESEEDAYDPRGKSGPHRGMESDGRAASTHYYGDSDYRQGARADKYGPGPTGPKHPSKSLAPAAISKRSKHRKQGMEQKVSKFSPIEEARDVESDLASYPPAAGSSGLASRGRRFQDEITYGLKKNVYEQQRHYGVASRDAAEEDDRMYSGSSRARGPAAYGGEKLSSHDVGSRGKGYEREREAVERLQKAGPKPSSLSMAHGRARPPMRSQASEEESPVSPLGRPRPTGDALPPGDTCPQFCSSHSMPDVQEHVRNGPRAHTYKREEGYLLDDSHCVVSDSEAYHLGQEETDWFDKPRDARSDRFRHHGGHAASSSQKRGPARHSYHDYDEPPEEGLWPHEEGGPGRHAVAKEHRHHGDHGRHSGRHAGEEPGRRAAKPHARDLGRHEARPAPQPSPAPATQKKGQPGYPSSAEYTQPPRVPSAYHHASDSKKGSRQAPQPKPEPQPQPQGRQAPPGPQPSQQPAARQTPSAAAAAAARAPQPQPQPQLQGPGPQPPQQTPQARTQQQGQPAARGPAAATSQPAGKPQPGPAATAGSQPAGAPRTEQTTASKGAAKAAQQGRPPQAQPPPGPGPAGMKAGARPGGTPGAPAGQPGAEGDSVFSKILPGGAAEQAGKLTEAVSAFGKKFSSFW
uniref:Bassoon presynaptic cytomatrix protein n=1 Tax=Myotis lucifugus TaxID=59463 RepID=G1PSX5_MYOLU